MIYIKTIIFFLVCIFLKNILIILVTFFNKKLIFEDIKLRYGLLHKVDVLKTHGSNSNLKKVS